MVAISACLAGSKCRYDGTNSYDQSLLESITDKYIEVCPEIIGGFGVPRLPCEISEGDGREVLEGAAKILDRNGNDVTAQMLYGAKRALSFCQEANVKRVYLKQKSPMCGCGQIYDGSFTGKLKKGNGVFAELLQAHGFEVINC